MSHIASNPDYLEITGVDLPSVIQAAYALSVPVGLGYLHHRDGPLDPQQAIQIVARADKDFVNVDYLNGRAVKLTVHRDGERLFIPKRWFDHTVAQLAQLLTDIGMHQKISQL